MWTLVGIVTALLLLFLWVRRPKKPPNFPPGPPTFLIFGNIRQLMKAASGQFFSLFATLRREHGSDVIALLDPTGKPMVHIFGAKLIREACSKPEFSGRPTQFPVLFLNSMQKAGVFFNEGPVWQELRRFCLQHLGLSLDNNTMGKIIADEYDHLAKHLTKQVGQEVDANSMFKTSTLNLLWKMIANKRYDHDDPERLHLREVMDGFTKVVSPQSPVALFPWTRFIAPTASGFTGLKHFRDEIGALFARVIQDHRDTLDVNKPRDLVDAFLVEMQKPGAAARGYTELNLTAIGVDFFVAGSETTSLAMAWSMLLLVTHPDVQTRLQEELDRVLPGHQQPSYQHRAALPYTEAVINEVIRYSCFVPMSVPHHTSTGPVQLAGYTIPKDSIVFNHLHSAHKDPEYWGDPEVFRPERFLTADGKFKKDEQLMPFGTGRRLCLGEQLAQVELFVFFSSLFRQFSVRLPAGAPPPSQECPFGIFRKPPDFDVVLELRA